MLNIFSFCYLKLQKSKVLEIKVADLQFLFLFISLSILRRNPF